MTKAMSPADIAGYKAKAFPDWVFEAFNQCIAMEYTGKRATVKQDAVIDKMIELQGGAFDEAARQSMRRTIFDKGYLNVEEVYREQGWNVEYDKPGYNESYGAFWVFKG